MSPKIAEKINERVKELKSSIHYRKSILADHQRRQISDSQALMDSSLSMQDVQRINTRYLDRKRVIEQLQSALKADEKQLKVYEKDLGKHNQPRLI